VRSDRAHEPCLLVLGLHEAAPLVLLGMTAVIEVSSTRRRADSHPVGAMLFVLIWPRGGEFFAHRSRAVVWRLAPRNG